MKRKTKLILSSIVMTALTCQFVSSTPYSWSVRYAKGAPSSQQKYSDSAFYAVTYDTYYIPESCLNAYNPTDQYGYVGYVEYTGRYFDGSTYTYNIYPTYAHYSTQATHNISLSNFIPRGYIIYGDYSLTYYYGASAMFDGSYGA